MSVMNVGYARTDITPKESVPLMGYGNTKDRMSNNVLDPLYATCIAFVNDAGEKALIFTIDFTDGGCTTTTEIRPAISEATGIPVEYIQVAGTHTHSAPDVRGNQFESVVNYREYMKTQMVKAAVEALADAKPARLYMTRTMTQHIHFLRHYIMEDGTYAGPNFGDRTLTPVSHVGKADDEMQLVKITREGGKDIILCNFGVHLTCSGGMKKYDVSADIAGAMRKYVEANRDVLFAYFTGACGNLAHDSMIKEENVLGINLRDFDARGKALSEFALAAEDTYTEAAFGAIRACARDIECEVNHSTDHLAEKAREIYAFFFATNDRDLANEMARKHGFRSVYDAGAVMRRSDLPPVENITLNAVCVGDLAFSVAPYEMFSENGRFIKDNSQFPMTFVLTVANDRSYSYMPILECFKYGSYEANSCPYLPGIAEHFANEFVDMLHELKK